MPGVFLKGAGCVPVVFFCNNTFNDAKTIVNSHNFYTYTYDAVGNRLSQTIGTITTSYTYDIANRLTTVNGINYTWDNNGNLLNDGVNIYTYDHANRLISVVSLSTTSSYAYNGLGDRLQQTVDGVTENYTLDLNNPLTQVLADGTHTYLYGAGRIALFEVPEAAYFLGDALSCVRQLADSTMEVTLVVSKRTVESHIANIRSKLGFTELVQIVRRAI